MELAIQHKDKFPAARSEAILRMMSQKDRVRQFEFTKLPLDWTWMIGDLQQTMHRASKPHVIFYDPYSQKTNIDLWSADWFRSFFATIQGQPCIAATYSTSKRVRNDLIAAGFHVARGQGFSQKEESTLFFTPRAAQEWNELPLIQDQNWIVNHLL